ncbi:choice-of-anchor D domain-containing protein [Granulicella sp. L46]|uniref:choice-of-anchor D domain-containing protein n=1 Tax=Granulicella sp. L46 TaxID=1641865 RepID=UPI00131E2E17|nr:choice-of-anchor D domain-containing protein [Granulicella sp. L46]
MSGSIYDILSPVSRLKSTCLARFGVALILFGMVVPGFAQTVTPASTSLTFTSAQVGISAGTAESLTETFTITGFSSLITPTATMHYGLSYTAGAVSCTGSLGSQSCTVSVKFTPTYPGGRRDALFLMNGTTRLATVLVYGIGESPFALLQPGMFSTSVSEAGYLYDSVVDENGVLYILETEQNTVLQRTKAGVITAMPITGLSSPRTIAIDGAGVLYIADQKPNSAITTYDTVRGVQDTFPWPTPSPGYIQSATVGNTGTVYEADYANIYIFPPTGSPTDVTIAPAITQPSIMTVDDAGNVFIGGYTINELTPGGTQTEVNTVGASEGLFTDAADTLYAMRYTAGGVAELPATGYGTLEASIDTAASPLGASIGPDGTVFVENYTNLDVVNRSSGAVAFGAQQPGTAATAQTITLYNGGNEPLTISGLALSGSATFTIGTLPSGNCTSSTTIAPGALCQVQLGFTSANPGDFTGTLTFTTNSLNQTAVTQTVALSATISGAYLVGSPTSLNFGSQTDGTTSTTQSITLTNQGYGFAADAYSVSTTDPAFTATLGSGCASVAVNATCTLNVTFAPTAVQSYSATGSVSVTDVGPGNAPSVSFSLSGNGTSASAPIAGLSPNPLVFPNVAVNSNYTQGTATLTNTGTATLTNIVASITGTNASEFVIYPTSTCTSTLAAGASCTYLINFFPTVVGGSSATLSVADSASGSPQTITLSGVGTPAAEPQVQFTPTVLSAIAGTGTMPINCVSPAEPGPALETQLCGPSAVAVDFSGNVYIAEPTANVVLKLDTTGNITTFAGVQGSAGSFSGDNGPANAAHLNAPSGLAVDGLGNVYISDSGNLRIREVNATTHTITTFVGGGSGTYFNGGTGAAVVLAPAGIAFDPSGNLYIAEPTQQIVVKVTSIGVATLFAGVQAPGGAGMAGYNGDNIQANTAELNAPTSVASDRNGNIYIADSLNYRIRYINENFEPGLISTAAGNGTAGNTGDGGVATSAEITPLSITLNEADDIFISNGTTLRKASNQGYISTFAGGGTGGLGGPATAALLSGVGQPGIDNNGNVLIPITGTPQVLSAGPTGLLQFGNQATGTTSAPLTVTVENTGNNFLNFNSLNFTATGPFSVTGGTCEQETDGGYSPSETCTLTVTFTPTATGAQTGSISVASNALASPSSITLQGTGTAAAAPTATLSPGTLSFGSVASGVTSSAQMLTLSNTGNAALTISGITIVGANPSDFAETNTCGGSLAAGATCTISVTFTPGSVASFAATVSVADNATGSPQTATLSGSGTAPAAPIAALSPSTVSFGNVVTGATASAQTVTLSNTGNAAMTISGVAIGGTNASDFAETTTCGESLAAGASCTIEVTFTPSSVASFTATVSVADSAAGSPQTASLSGAGIAAPDFTVSVTPAIETVNYGGVATYQVTVGSVNGDFSNAVALSATGLPTGATATFAPASVTPGGESEGSVLTIQTASLTAQAHAPSGWRWMPGVTLAFCIPLLWWRRRERIWRLGSGLLCLLLSVGAAMLTGCGGGYYSQAPARTYTVTVTGTSGSTQHSTTVTLTVQ